MSLQTRHLMCWQVLWSLRSVSPGSPLGLGGEPFSLWPLPGPLYLCAFQLDLKSLTHRLRTSQTQLRALGGQGLHISSRAPTGPGARAQDLLAEWMRVTTKKQTDCGAGGISLRVLCSPVRSRTPNKGAPSIPRLKVEMWQNFLGFKNPAFEHQEQERQPGVSR